MTEHESGALPPDSDLIEAWKRGDETAAAELVRRHAPAVARYLAAAGAADDVDDLVQEAFFRAFKKIDSFRGGAQFRTWVMAIGSNALKDQRRRLKRREVVPLEGRDVPDGQGDPHSEMVGRDLESRLEEAVADLPELQREVFLLRAQQGFSYDEIADALDTTPGSARVHYHHAVKKLKEILQ